MTQRLVQKYYAWVIETENSENVMLVLPINKCTSDLLFNMYEYTPEKKGLLIKLYA